MIWPQTLAIIFASPWNLMWLLAVAIPIAIALWRQRHVKTVPWASNFLLKKSLEKRSRLAKWKQWLLLSARVCFLVLLVLAAAGPLWTASNSIPESLPTPDTVVIVIDTSFSMEQSNALGDRLLKAKNRANDIVRSSNENAQFIIVDGSALLPTIANNQLLNEPTAIARISSLESKPNAARILSNLTSTLQQIGIQTDQPSAIRIHIISDFDESAIRSLDVDNLAELRKQFREIVAIDIEAIRPPNESSNLVVQSINIDSALVLKNRELVVSATIEHVSGSAPVKTRATLFVNDIAINSRNVLVPPGEPARVEFQWTPRMTGDATLSVRIEDEAIQTDNRRFMVAKINETLQIAIVAESHAEARFLKLAASVTLDRGGLEIETISRDQLNQPSSVEELRKADCLMMIELKSSDVNRVVQYLMDGGNVLFCCGERTAPSAVTALRAKLEKEIGLGTNVLQLSNWPALTAPSSIGQFEIADSDYARRLGLTTTPIFRYWQIENQSQVDTLLALSNGDTVALASLLNQIGSRGETVVTIKVVWLLTSVTMDPLLPERDWNALPIWPTFVPFIQDTVKDLTRWDERRTFRVGQRIVVASEAQRFQLTHPGGKTEDWVGEKYSRETEQSLSRNIVRLRQDDRTTTPFYSEIGFFKPGNYRLQSAAGNNDPSSQSFIAINTQWSESSSALPSLASLNSWIESNRGDDNHVESDQTGPQLLSDLQPWLARVCIGLAILCLVFESFISVFDKR